MKRRPTNALPAVIRPDRFSTGGPGPASAGLQLVRRRSPPWGGTDGHADLSAHAVQREIGALSIRVAALADVIRSKEASGRAKDIRR